TSLTLNDERAYNPATGGWTTKDPTGFTAGDANTGRYSGNSPTNAVDPTGLAAVQGPWSGANYMASPALQQAYAEWIGSGISPTVPPGFWQSLMNVVDNEVTTQYLMMMHPLATAQGTLNGLADGGAMVFNAATFHQYTPLNNYVTQAVATNGGLYGVANMSAHVGVCAGYAAGGFALAGYAGLSYVGTVPIQYAPMQFGIEYMTWGVGLGGAASYPSSQTTARSGTYYPPDHVFGSNPTLNPAGYSGPGWQAPTQTAPAGGGFNLTPLAGEPNEGSTWIFDSGSQVFPPTVGGPATGNGPWAPGLYPGAPTLGPGDLTTID
ncbi:MAG: RHS repeat-associated core domain-containing protein, partial [Pirellulales bacterium]